MPIVGGIRLPREQTLELAAMLSRDGSDRTARLLLEAITSGQEFVALGLHDRRAILDVLDHPPEGLVELRSALFEELNWRRGLPQTTTRSGMSPYARRSG
jgi:hypothetical protein